MVDPWPAVFEGKTWGHNRGQTDERISGEGSRRVRLRVAYGLPVATLFPAPSRRHGHGRSCKVSSRLSNCSRWAAERSTNSKPDRVESLWRTMARDSKEVSEKCSDKYTISPTAGGPHITAEVPPRLISRLNPCTTGVPGSPRRVTITGTEIRNRGWRRGLSYCRFPATSSCVYIGALNRRALPRGQICRICFAIYDGHACRAAGGKCRLARITSRSSLLSTGF